MKHSELNIPNTTRSRLLEIARTAQLLANQLLALHRNLAVDESNESVSASSGYCSMNESVSTSSRERSSKRIKMTEIIRPAPPPILNIKEMRNKRHKLPSQEKLKLRLVYNN